MKIIVTGGAGFRACSYLMPSDYCQKPGTVHAATTSWAMAHNYKTEGRSN